MSANGKESISDIFNDGKRMDAAMRRGVQKALRMHKLLGYPVVSADKDGNPIWIPPEEIVLDEEIENEKP